MRASSQVVLPHPSKSAFVSGRHRCCADPTCTRPPTGLVLDRELWDAIDRVIVGEEHCPCGAQHLFTRKAVEADLSKLTHHHAIVYWRAGYYGKATRLGEEPAAAPVVEPLDALDATKDEWNHPVEWPTVPTR